MTVCKPGPWSQGPVFLQQLALLDGFDLEAMGLGSAEYVHTIVECAKLAFADREAFYGDPAFADVPVPMLLSAEYNAARRALVGAEASLALRPGGGRLPAVDPRAAGLAGAAEPGRPSPGGATRSTSTSPTDSATSCPPHRAAAGCRAHRSSPVSASRSAPARRCSGSTRSTRTGSPRASVPAPPSPPRSPCATASRTSRSARQAATARTSGRSQFFLAHAVFGLDLQTALDLPQFDTRHLRSSFYPRRADPGVLEADGDLGSDVLEDLRARGHLVETLPAEAFGRTSAAGRDRDGTLVAGATGRGNVSFAVGR